MSRGLAARTLRAGGWMVAGAALVVSAACGGTPIAPPPPPPTLTVACPQNVDVQSMDGTPVTVNFDVPQAAGGVPPLTTTCSAQSGPFTVGSTAVTCQATDSRTQTASCSFTVAVRPPPRLQFTRFLAFGDSLTSGEVSPAPGLRIFLPNESWPAVLERRLMAYYKFQIPRVFNEGLGGEMAHNGGIARFRQKVREIRPDAVLLMEGTNDLLDQPDTGRGADLAIDALRQMLQEAKSQNVRIAIATIPPQRPGGRRDTVARLIPSFNDRVRALAESESVLLIDIYAAMKDDLSLIGVDDLHATIRGYDVMAGVFFEAIKANFEEPFPAARRGVF